MGESVGNLMVNVAPEQVSSNIQSVPSTQKKAEQHPELSSNIYWPYMSDQPAGWSREFEHFLKSVEGWKGLDSQGNMVGALEGGFVGSLIVLVVSKQTFVTKQSLFSANAYLSQHP